MSTTLGEALVGIVAVTTLPLGILAALFFGLFEAFVVFVVGWLFLVPVLGILMEGLGLMEDDETSSVGDAIEDEVARSVREATPGDEPVSDGAGEARSDQDPLEALRERYARGEIDDAEFERKLERLIETEDVEVPPEVSLDRTDATADSEEDREPAYEE